MRIRAHDHHAANNDERNPFGRRRHARGVREPARTAGTEPRRLHTGRRWSNVYRTRPGGDERQGSIAKSRAGAARVKGRQREIGRKGLTQSWSADYGLDISVVDTGPVPPGLGLDVQRDVFVSVEPGRVPGRTNRPTRTI
jgi:hypothetical protein